MLELKGVRASYGEMEALKGVSLRVGKGEIVGLIGANAAGKSTMLACVSGLLKTTAGEITFDGRRVDGAPPSRIVEAGLVQVPEGRLLFPKLTVRENLMLGAYAKRSRTGWKARLEEVYGILPKLKEREGQLAGSLSGGEAQMCAIGRGLMADPAFAMFDEPSLGLSPAAADEVMGIIGGVREKGVTVLLVEQNVRRTLTLADRAYVMENGKIILEGAAKALLGDPLIRKAYLGEAGESP
ncbi:MAG: ABC transporter ATP-binding protein [Clostridiales Family XIII bacterium]|jgi:branched-chain amino acid transport system ATP-binding protein|nr:ABC transporter ATP-binding protein [Clostridiales Family XIII bacterium]